MATGISGDVTTKRRSPLQRALHSRTTTLAVVLGLVAVAALVVPIIVFVQRVVARQPAIHRLERMAKQAQPPSAVLIDSGLHGDDGRIGFAYGLSSQLPPVLLEIAPPPPWTPGPPLPESPDTRLYRSGQLILSVRVTPCVRLAQCRPGDALVYTEVQDIT